MLRAFAVKDLKANAYIIPFFCVNRGVAVRSFEAAANQEGHEFNRFANDFMLFEIGSYDEVGGVMIPEEHYQLGIAAEFIKGNGLARS